MQLLLLLITLELSVAFLFLLTVQCTENPEELVNLLAGTFTDGNYFSTGNTLPLVSLPWGFNSWAPQTKEGSKRTGSWWFSGNDHELTFLRCTHQPSPWIGDWGWFLFSPQISRNADRNPHHYWEPRGATIKPHLFDTIVAPFNIRIELTPTIHGSISRYTFPTIDSEIYREYGDKRICFVEANWGNTGSTFEHNKNIYYITGKANQINKDRMLVSNFNLYIHITSETDEYLTTEIENHGEMFCFKYTTNTNKKVNDMNIDGRNVIIRITTSLISESQALVSMKYELPLTMSFDEIALTAKSIWNKYIYIY